MPNSRRLRDRFERALILENPHPDLDGYLAELGIEPERLPESATQDEAFVRQRLTEGAHDLLFKRSRFPVDDALLESAPHLAAVMLCCIGDDSVDKEACARHGVLVLNDPVSNGRSVAELVLGEMICLARRIFDSHDAGRRHLWTKDATERYELKGKTLGVIGLGNIGKQVARMADAFGMDVLFYDTHVVAREVGLALGWRAVGSIGEAFAQSDVVSLHVSAEDRSGRSNRDLITPDHFAALASERGPGSPRLFLNAARGFLYEPDDLLAAVEAGQVRAAAVDVFPEEPGSKRDPWENPYAPAGSIVTTPHIGAATQEAQPRIARFMAGSARLLQQYGTVRETVYAPQLTIGVEAEMPYWTLAIVHADARGTRKAIADAIYDAGVSTLQSAHRDFAKYGIAYDVSAMDGPLPQDALDAIVESAARLTGDASAIRSVRQFEVR
jgi:D-3-phosphoglycerate dehydrogenase